MERKSLVIGPRTRQDILKGKHIRKYEDGGDNFDDYWTDSDDASSSISKDSEHFLELPNETSHKQSSIFLTTSDGRNSSLRQRTDQSPLKSRGVQSPLRSRAVQSPLKSRGVLSPLRSRAVHSPLKSRGVQSPLRSRAVQSPLKSRGVQSPLRSKNCQSPLKPRNCQSPLKPRNYQSPPKSRGGRSQPKSEEVLLDNILNVNEISTEFQDMTINLGIEDNNPETEALNRFSDNVKNNLPPKLSSITSEIQNISNSSQSNDKEEYNESEMPRLVSKVSFKTSKKSISRSTKKDLKIREVQMQFDELDEKIMQMVRVNDDDDIQSPMVSEEEMSMTEQQSFVGEKKKHEIEHVF